MREEYGLGDSVADGIRSYHGWRVGKVEQSVEGWVGVYRRKRGCCRFVGLELVIDSWSIILPLELTRASDQLQTNCT